MERIQCKEKYGLFYTVMWQAKYKYTCLNMINVHVNAVIYVLCYFLNQPRVGLYSCLIWRSDTSYAKMYLCYEGQSWTWVEWHQCLSAVYTIECCMHKLDKVLLSGLRKCDEITNEKCVKWGDVKSDSTILNSHCHVSGIFWTLLSRNLLKFSQFVCTKFVI